MFFVSNFTLIAKKTELECEMDEQDQKNLFVLEGLGVQLRTALETARCSYNLQNKVLTAQISESISKVLYAIADILKTILRCK